jgi:hypothetical protein
MIARKAILSLGALGTLAVLATSVDAGEKQASKRRRITAAQCERLVEQLVSPHKPPFKEDYVPELPAGVREADLYDRQRKIAAAYDALSDNIEVSLPVLAKHVPDKRFSYVYEETAGTAGGYLQESVGGACRDIIGQHVEVYHRHTTRYVFEGLPRSLWFINDGCGGVEEWWKTRKGKTLAELQLEAIGWVLRQNKPKEFKSEKEWAKALKSCEEMAKRIRTSKKPILVEHHVQFFSK